MLAVTPFVSSTAVWPISGDVPDLQQIVWDQMRTIAANAALIAAYQQVLGSAQAIPNATGTGTITGTPTNIITMSGVVGTILLGSTITGLPGIPAGSYLIHQNSGTAGGNGQYVMSNQSTADGSSLLTISPGGGNPPWPTATDAPTLMLLTQDQTAIVRMQNSLLQNYQTLLNDSSTAPPATGP